MRFVIQRVSHADVKVNEEIIGRIDKGFLVLIGIADNDTEEMADRMVKKLIGLRIFQDAEGKTNLNLEQVGGSLLLISQFTLYADCRKGNRPSFIHAGEPQKANALYEYIIRKCRESGIPTEQGSFGADMDITLTNQGPFTVLLDSSELA